jgi:hypothetical protein
MSADQKASVRLCMTLCTALAVISPQHLLHANSDNWSQCRVCGVSAFEALRAAAALHPKPAFSCRSSAEASFTKYNLKLQHHRIRALAAQLPSHSSCKTRVRNNVVRSPGSALTATACPADATSHSGCCLLMCLCRHLWMCPPLCR